MASPGALHHLSAGATLARALGRPMPGEVEVDCARRTHRKVKSHAWPDWYVSPCTVRMDLMTPRPASMSISASAGMSAHECA
jgi:hypothetical protein